MSQTVGVFYFGGPKHGWTYTVAATDPDHLLGAPPKIEARSPDGELVGTYHRTNDIERTEPWCIAGTGQTHGTTA